MGLFKFNLKSSVLALLRPADIAPSELQDRTEDVRGAILAAMGEFGEKNYPGIIRHVRYANDAQGLWYARGDVMKVLAAVFGETIAREKLAAISEKFQGLLPSGLHSRPSPLDH
jgi:hypothetical protein